MAQRWPMRVAAGLDIFTFQFIEQKKWIAKTFPRDRRYENMIAVGENMLTADVVRYVRLNIYFITFRFPVDED